MLLNNNPGSVVFDSHWLNDTCVRHNARTVCLAADDEAQENRSSAWAVFTFPYVLKLQYTFVRLLIYVLVHSQVGSMLFSCFFYFSQSF